MKLVKTASGKSVIKMSKSEWQSIGKKAGWLGKQAQIGDRDRNNPLLLKLIEGLTKGSDPEYLKSTYEHSLNEDHKDGLQLLIASNPNCPPDLLARMAKDPNTSASVLRELARNPNTPPDAIGRNPNAPLDTNTAKSKNRTNR